MKILLFGTMGQIGQSVLHSLRDRHGYDAVLVDFAQNMLRDEPGYRIFLDRAIKEHAPSVVIPIGSQLALARFREGIPIPRNRKTFPDHVTAISESCGKLLLLDSKVQCSRLAESLDIRQPHIYSSPDEAINDTHTDWMNIVFKRDRSFGGCGVFRPTSPEALRRLIAHQPDMPFLVEEYVPGYDVSVDAIRFPGYFKAGCYRTLARIGGQGPASERTVIDRPDLCLLARRILDRVDYSGVCGFDFRISESDGTPYFLESNPRFTGGIDTQIEAGFDIPYELLSTFLRTQGLQ